MTGALPTFAPALRSLRRSTNSKTANRRLSPTIWARTGCISPGICWEKAGCRSANKKPSGGSSARRADREHLEASLPQTGGIAAGRHGHAMGRRHHDSPGARIFDRLDLPRRRRCNRGCAGNGTGPASSPEFCRPHGGSGRRRRPAGATTAHRGGARCGAVACPTACADRRDRGRAGFGYGCDEGRGRQRGHRTTLQRGRMEAA